MQLLIKVITSWQVIAITVALVLYIYIVSYVARGRHYQWHKAARKAKVKMKKKKKAAPVVAGPDEVAPSPNASINDELGLEEA